MKLRIAVAVLAAVSLAPRVALANGPAPVAPEDLFKIAALSDAAISPDGSRVLVTVTRADGPSNAYVHSIAMIDAHGGRLVEQVTGGTGDGDYAWMPDGRSFVFVRTLEKQRPQLYRFTIDSGQTVKLTDIEYGVSSPAVSHDGRHIALSVNVPAQLHGAYVDFSKAGFTPTAQERATDIHTIDKLFFEQNGTGYTYRDHNRIWVVDADGSNAKQLTFGDYSETFDAWSPDDRTILFNSLQHETADSGPTNLYAISADGGTPRELPSVEPQNLAMFYSNDGSTVYYLRSDVKDAAELAAVVAANADGSNARTIVPKNRVGWGDSLLADMKEGGGACALPLHDGRHAVVNADGPGYANLRTLDLQTGDLRDLTPPAGEAWSCSLSRDGTTLAYLYSDFLHPAELYVVPASGGTPLQLTHVNDAYLASVRLSVPQPLAVKDSAGTDVQAWFMPATGGSGGKRPTLLDIHGGPETQFGDTFFHEFQYYCSLGYNVVFADPRGSTGHGYAFTEALESNWGDPMFDDVQAVMDAATKRSDVDAARLGVLGGSYGGYAVLWVIAHTDRYKVAVAERAVSNMESEMLAADAAGKNALGGGVYAWGRPWDRTNPTYARMSPLSYVSNVRTPLMLLHSSLDTRTPIDQTLQEFTALKILGATVEYVEVPNENHDLSRDGSPIHRVERLHLIADWIGRYLLP
ncbi:MAG: S9 family peptidase [Candidatus Eremiobacteraeota bacterium]|nr:S9 family peptidase [Candidatus Eremiobacteraeota bacterium]